MTTAHDRLAYALRAWDVDPDTPLDQPRPTLGARAAAKPMSQAEHTERLKRVTPLKERRPVRESNADDPLDWRCEAMTAGYGLAATRCPNGWRERVVVGAVKRRLCSLHARPSVLRGVVFVGE